MLVNRARATAIMEREGLDAIVATTPEHVLYLSDFETRLPFFTGTGAAAVLPRDESKPAVLVVAVAYLGHVASEPSWMPKLRAFGALGVLDRSSGPLVEPETTTMRLLSQHQDGAAPSQAQAVADALEIAGVQNGTIGIDRIPGETERVATGATWKDARAAIRDIRIVKSPEEIERLRRAAIVNEEAFAAAERAVRIGGAWQDVLTAWRVRWAELGGTPLFWGSGAGPLGSQLFAERAKYTMRRGDLIRWEGGGTWRSYWADTGRSSVLGAATAEQQRAQEALVAGSERAQELLGPGMRGADVCIPVLETIRANGLDDFTTGNVWGHGVGLDLNESPRFRPATDDTLEPGMVIAFETPYFAVGWGGLQVEDTFLITEAGAERLTSAPRELQVLDADGAA